MQNLLFYCMPFATAVCSPVLHNCTHIYNIINFWNNFVVQHLLWCISNVLY